MLDVADALEQIGFPTDLSAIAIERRSAQEVDGDLQHWVDLVFAPTDFAALLAVRAALGPGAPADAQAFERAVTQAWRRPVYYAPRRRAIVFDDDVTASTDALRGPIAHAIVHAFQDAHMGGLEATLLGAATTGDPMRARVCAIEAHAAFVAASIVHGAEPTSKPRPPDLDLGLGLPACPAGVAVVGDLFAQGGWPAVLRFVGNPPESTEQILHPSKRDVDFPVRVGIVEWDDARLGPAQLVSELAVGEMTLVSLLVDAGLSWNEAQRVALGWDGDLLRVYRRAAGDEVLLWRSVWDRPEDVTQLARALRRMGSPFGLSYNERLVHAVVAPEGRKAKPLHEFLGGEVPPAGQADDARTTAEAEAALGN